VAGGGDRRGFLKLRLPFRRIALLVDLGLHIRIPVEELLQTLPALIDRKCNERSGRA